MDLNAALLVVQRQIASVEYERIETDPETAASRRTIHLDTGTGPCFAPTGADTSNARCSLPTTTGDQTPSLPLVIPDH